VGDSYLKETRRKSLLVSVIGSLCILSFLFSLNFLIAPAVRRTVSSGVKIDSVKKLSKSPKITKQRKPRSKPKAMQSLLSGLSSLGSSSFDLSVFDGLLEDSEDDSLKSLGLESAPNQKRVIEARYPAAAKKKGVEGHVVLNLLIDENGSVKSAQVLEAIPPGVFDDSAVEAVRQWSFFPAKKAGKNVEVWAQKTIRFSLQ